MNEFSILYTAKQKLTYQLSGKEHQMTKRTKCVRIERFIRLNNDTIKYLQRENMRTRIATVDANKSWLEMSFE